MKSTFSNDVFFYCHILTIVNRTFHYNITILYIIYAINWNKHFKMRYEVVRFHVINVRFCEDRLTKKVIQEAYNVVNSVCRLKRRLITIQSAAFFAS